MDKIADERLFQNHSKEQIMHWCQNLNYFHYMRARGGHNCEGDSFCAYFLYDGREDLITKLAEVGVTLTTLQDGFIAFDPFESYSLDDLDKLKFTIGEFADLEQPKYVDVFGHKVHIWVQAKRFEISVSGSKEDNTYEVSNEDFEVCSALEKELDKLAWKSILDDDIKTHIHCICKERYPELYK